MSILSKLAVTAAAALTDATIGRFDLFIDSADGKLKAYDATNTLQDIGGTPTFNVDLDSSESSVSRSFAGGRTTFTVTHNLNTLDIKPEVFRFSDGRTIAFRVERTSVNEVEVSRNGNIADGDYRLVI